MAKENQAGYLGDFVNVFWALALTFQKQSQKYEDRVDILLEKFDSAAILRICAGLFWSVLFSLYIGGALTVAGTMEAIAALWILGAIALAVYDFRVFDAYERNVRKIRPDVRKKASLRSCLYRRKCMRRKLGMKVTVMHRPVNWVYWVLINVAGLKAGCMMVAFLQIFPFRLETMGIIFKELLKAVFVERKQAQTESGTI